MIGIDEVGRGAWAGPLLVVAARLKNGKKIPRGLTDSKLLSAKSRAELSKQLTKTCDFGEGWVAAKEIDEIGLAKSLKLGALRAVEALNASINDEIIIDGKVNFLPDTYPKVKTKVKADASIPRVSAASIYAKVTRDNYMIKLSREYSHYNWQTNVGYGTQKHVDAINKYGVTTYHRKSFKPIKAILDS